jgi:hypothetical protein
MPSTQRRKSRTGNSAKKARLYHLSERTIKQIDVLAVLYGGKEAAVANAINATYEAAGNALRRLKVRVK